MEIAYILQIAVCEDTPADSALLGEHIEHSGVPCQRTCFESGKTFLRAFRAGRYDLIFLDIYMDGMSGVEVAKRIRESDPAAVLAFTTSSLDHTLDSYRLGALKYLEKPVTAGAVQETLELALMKKKARAAVTLPLAGGRSGDIPLDTILYFEQQGHVATVHTATETLSTSQSVKLDDIEKGLPGLPFLRCHRSYIVNLDYVRCADRVKHAFLMKNGDRADIRRGGFGKCEEAFKLWLLDKAGRR